MTPTDAAIKMTAFYDGNIADTEHFIKVWTYAAMIADGEHCTDAQKRLIGLSAVTHDIACPLCRVKYGNTNGKHQEEESEPLLREFFRGTDVTGDELERIVYLVTHHHTYSPIDGIDYQILLEADYLVNAAEKKLTKGNIENFRQKIMKTPTGINLLDNIFAAVLKC